MTPRELIVRWRSDADVLDRCAASSLAVLHREHAAALEAALHSADDDVLTLEQAAQASGFSASRLRHLVSEGAVPNAGRRGAPRVRRGDLPRKAKARATTFDAAAVAADVLTARRA